MNTKEISSAQLSVSKHFTVESINDLIDRFSIDGFNSYYNTETKSIDVETDAKDFISNITIIKQELKNWIDELPVDFDTAKIVRDNLEFIFNITQLPIETGNVIKVYLY